MPDKDKPQPEQAENNHEEVNREFQLPFEYPFPSDLIRDTDGPITMSPRHMNR